jgi:hypothetical protein
MATDVFGNWINPDTAGGGMKVGASTFSNLGGAVSDLFAGFGAQTAADLKAQGIHLSAYGTRIGAAGTMLQAAGLRVKAGGDIAEAGEYDLAAQLARQNKQYTEQSTAIQQLQLERNISSTIGGVRAGLAASGLKASGSGLYLLADSARQGALAHQVLSMQGQITEAGYEEQAQSYDVMAGAARMAASGETGIAAGTEAISGLENRVAAQTDYLAEETKAAGQQQATGDFIGSALKGVAAIATLFP